jgi:PAS domain S-box-containing protein
VDLAQSLPASGVVNRASLLDVFSGLRVRLTLLIALAIVVTFATTLYNLRRERAQALHEAEEDTRAIVRLAHDEYQRLVAGSEQLLVGLAELPAVRDNRAAECSAYFGELGRRFPYYSSLGAARADGAVFCSSVPIDPGLNLADRPTFQLAVATRSTVMSPVVTGRLSKKRVVTFFRAAFDATGAVRAVVHLGLDLTYLGTHAAQTTLPPGGDLNILDGTGTLLARHPALPEWIGRPATDEPLFRAFTARTGERLHVAHGLDGVERLYAFVQVKGAPPPGIVLAVGMPVERAVAAVDAAWRRQLLLFTIVSAGALAIGWWGAELSVRRPVGRLLAATRAIARGDLAARSGLRRGSGELGMLASSFDAMAEALETRTAALAEATATLETRVHDRTAELEEASRRVQAQLAFIVTVLDTQHSLVMVIDAQGRIVLVNRECEHTWGYRAEELHGADVFDTLVMPADVDRVRRAFESVLAGTEPLPMESRSLTRDGAVRMVAWSAGVIRNSRGAVEYVVATGIDITERREAEERYRLLADHVTDVLWTCDLALNPTYCSPSVERFLGYSVAEVLARPFDALAAPSSRAVVASTLRGTVTADGAPDSVVDRVFEMELVRKDGRSVWAETRATVLRDASGAAIAILGVTRDISERKRSEDKLRELASIIECSDDAIVGKRLDGTIVSWNPAAERLYGYRAEEAIGRSATMLAPPERADEFQQMLSLVVREDRLTHWETVRVTRDGRRLTVAMTVSPIRDARGVLTGISTIARDLTEQRRAEERLRQAEKLTTLGELLSGVAHELNNPLAVVSGYAQILADDQQVPPGVRERLARINSQAQRAARIIRNLLTFARRRTPQRGQVAVPAIMDQALDFIAYPVRASGITVTREPAPAVPPIVGDADEILQVFVNILTNAVQALEQWEGPREISVGFEVTATKVRARIHNSGPHIAPETAARVFEPFFTTKAPGAGTGLGLSICYGIVASHGGEISVISAPGEGATFVVELPPAVLEPAPSLTRPDGREPAHPTGRRILVVDDEEPILAFVGDALRSWGNAVTLARSGREALAHIRAGTAVDAIVLDLRMPDLDGRQFYRHLEAEVPHLAARVVFATGDIVGVTGGAPVPGGRPVLHKPFDLRVLGETLAQLVVPGHAGGPEVIDARATAADREGRPQLDPRP